MNARLNFVLVMCSLALAAIGMIPGCLSADPEEIYLGDTVDDLTSPTPCTLDAPRYPTTPTDMNTLYAGRTFLVDNVHLGHDVALPQGTPVYAVGCGIVRVYRPASGYGRLVVVIEHALATPLVVPNGAGQTVMIVSFLTIYGHLRVSQDANGTVGVLGIKPGDMVGPDDVIGYVDQDSTNGDGDVHLHFGIRLQTAKEAAASDVNWFRGYDATPSQRAWFADPVVFMKALTASVMPVSWHPSGTLLQHPDDGTYWMVDAEARRHPVDLATVQEEALAARAVVARAEEFACLASAGPYVSPRAGSKLVKFDDASTVYEYSGLGAGHWRRAFISYEAFRSWGWQDSQVTMWPAVQRPSFFSQTEDHGYRTMREGSLVKADGESEVAVVSEDRRLPIVDWATFLALGYRQELIVTLPKSTIDLVGGPRGPLMTPALIAQCVHPGSQGGGSGEELPEVAADKLTFRYDGPVSGAQSFQGMWDPPGDAFFDWVPSTFALCPDDDPSDARLECSLDMPSGTQNFFFTVQLPDGRWWGDLSCAPDGGCGSTIGSITLIGSSGILSYELVPNGSGSEYVNGYVHTVP